MNLKEIKEMINLMNENNLLELEIEREGTKIRIKKEAKETIGFAPVSEYKVEHIASPSVASKEAKSEEKTVLKTVEIKSPMVGTFYRAPSPEAAPFVEIGQEIEIGQVVCIIEAMKLMNEIKSEVKGKIVDILVDNAEPVEFGQNLILIEPA
ncbi:MAG: acetyl-CoA carboxylase biotin carboxyl carrier protein [Candidatus Omnitrophica bacterium]|nr:acetyl-CoA carboxylase biotin carboxyl carrier protein [Candidatus Omnitrophota bacterium]HOX54975.1 acetyl-CoA carboxylase biotin carboxyl carrier protein [Candidatus Omnitrophota bacterium]